MPINPIENHLQAAIEELERNANEGRYNTMCMRALGSAARQLGREAIASRAIRLLSAAPDCAFSAGMITNIELSATVLERLRSIDTRAELRSRQWPYQAQEVEERIRRYAADEEHLTLCLSGRVQEARALAGSGARLEEIGVTLAVLGEFELAQGISNDPALERCHRKPLQIVLFIELFRREQDVEASAVLVALESAGLSVWDRIHLAFGLAGREPWDGYPFGD